MYIMLIKTLIIILWVILKLSITVFIKNCMLQSISINKPFVRFVKSHLFGLPKGNACIILIYGEVDIESFLALENAVVVMVGKSSLGGIPWLNAD